MHLKCNLKVKSQMLNFVRQYECLSQAVTNKVGHKIGARQEEANTSRVCEIFRMNPPSFTGSSFTEDRENFIEEL